MKTIKIMTIVMMSALVAALVIVSAASPTPEDAAHDLQDKVRGVPRAKGGEEIRFESAGRATDRHSDKRQEA